MGSFHHNTQIENESKVAQEESSETYEKAPQDACEIQVNNSQHPDLGHFTYRTNTMTTQPPRLRHLPHQLLRLFQHSRSHAQFGTRPYMDRFISNVTVQGILISVGINCNCFDTQLLGGFNNTACNL